MRGTTWFWVGMPDGRLFEGATPWQVLGVGATDTPAGKLAREGILARYRNDVKRFAFRLTHLKDESEEVEQEFCLVYLKPEIYQGLTAAKGHFRAFLKEWVRNAVQRRRTDRSRLREESLDERQEGGFDVEGTQKDLGEQFDEGVTQARVDHVLARMKRELREPHAWEVFAEWHLPGDPRDDADEVTLSKLGERYGLTVKQVRGLLERTRTSFVLFFAQLVAPEVRSAEALAMEFDLTREMLDGRLARLFARAIAEGQKE